MDKTCSNQTKGTTLPRKQASAFAFQAIDGAKPKLSPHPRSSQKKHLVGSNPARTHRFLGCFSIIHGRRVRLIYRCDISHRNHRCSTAHRKSTCIVFVRARTTNRISATEKIEGANFLIPRRTFLEHIRRDTQTLNLAQFHRGRCSSRIVQSFYGRALVRQPIDKAL